MSSDSPIMNLLILLVSVATVISIIFVAVAMLSDFAQEVISDAADAPVEETPDKYIGETIDPEFCTEFLVRGYTLEITGVSYTGYKSISDFRKDSKTTKSFTVDNIDEDGNIEVTPNG